jgi:hypothetical protein
VLLVGAATGVAKQRLRGWEAGLSGTPRRRRPDLLERAGVMMNPLRSGFLVGAIAAAVVSARPAAAQNATPLTLRGVPQGTLSATPLPLTLKEAVDRGLQQNLAAILEEQRLKGAESTRLEALSALLPHVGGSLRQSEQKISTASFGFQFPGVPTVIGPFDVFDARLTLSTPLFDARAIGGVRAARRWSRPAWPTCAMCARRSCSPSAPCICRCRRTPRASSRRAPRSPPPRRWSASPAIRRRPGSSPASTCCASRCSCSRRAPA